MAEKIRVRCPVCGSMPNLDQLLFTEENKPAEIRVFLHKFGGKLPVEDQGAIPLTKKKKGSAPGYSEYIDITDDQPEEVAKVKTWFDKRVAEYLEGGGG
ncbi:hypothetical protein LCGC14_3007880 [marine sediment metagenome]|uniref:Uncharacterized protein n=1 Tax=marine sediment metagenome TaxID=412755 RepID=A0A0F8Z6R3_9ZZZZ